MHNAQKYSIKQLGIVLISLAPKMLQKSSNMVNKFVSSKPCLHAGFSANWPHIIFKKRCGEVANFKPHIGSMKKAQIKVRPSND